MNGPLHPSLLGSLLAALFAIPMAALLFWMLRLPRAVPQEVARAVRSVGAVQTILVPILEHYYSERAVELAGRLGQTQKATILIGYVVEVPRTLPLGVPLPHVEEQASRALAQAKTICAMHSLQAQIELIRVREVGEGIARVARDRGVDLIVLGISPGERLSEGSTVRAAESLLRHAPCEVIIDRLAETSIGADASEVPAGAAGAGLPRKEAPRRPV